MSPYIEICVSFLGRHLFATAPRSIENDFELKRVMRIFLDKFPESQGYKINVTKWVASGTDYTDKAKVLGDE